VTVVSFSQLLERWCAGDGEALAALLEQELPWIRTLVRRRLGGLLRRAGDTQDYVQEALLDVLRLGPRFVVAERRHFRGLIARIVENTLRDQHERFTAARRDLRREASLGSPTTLHLVPGARPATRPSDAASRSETGAWVCLALELLEPDDRRIIVLRGYRELEFKEVAADIGTTVKAAQMRFSRALQRLARKLEELQAGRLERALGAAVASDEQGAHE